METTEVATSEDQRWVSLARDAFTGSSTWFDTNVRTRVINDIRQFQGEHPQDSKYLSDSYKLRSKLFRPKTRTAIRKSEAEAASAYFSSEDVVAIRPVDDDDPEQVKAAEFHKALLQLRLTRPHPVGLPWFLTLCGGVQDALSVGVVASYQDWKIDADEKIDRPDVTLLPVENYRFSPAADWRNVVNSSPYFIIRWPMYVKDVRAKMKAEKNPWRQYEDSQIKIATEPNDTIRQAREKGTDSKAAETLSDFTIAWVHENFIKTEEGDVVFFTLGTTHLLSDPIPVKDRYPQGRPVVVGFSIVESHKPYKPSLGTLTREVQSEINDLANLRIDATRQSLRPPVAVKRAAQVDLRALTRRGQGSVILAQNPNEDIVPLKFDSPNAFSYQEQDRLNLDFDDMAGAFSGSSVQSNRNLNETVGGMNIISSNANQVSEYQLRVINETWVEPVLRQLIILEQTLETDDTVLAYAAKQAGIEIPPNARPSDFISEELMTKDVILNVSVGTGSANPQTQLERFAFGMGTVAKFMPQALASINTEEVVKELFGKLGYKDGARFFNFGQGENPELEQAMQQIEQLKAALAAKNPPEVVAAQVAKLEAETKKIDVDAIVGRMEALFAAMNTAQTAVQVPGVMPVADSIAKSGGFVDMDAPPIYPEGIQPQEIPPQAQIPQNTSPGFPAQADSGMMTGIEGGGNVRMMATGGYKAANETAIVSEYGQPETVITNQGAVVTSQPTVIPQGVAAQVVPDYDYEGYIAKYGKPDQSKGQHLTDEFKLPNHITFSTDSKYSTPETPGGKWFESNGKWHYAPSDYVIQQHGVGKLKHYFQTREPDAILVLPEGAK